MFVACIVVSVVLAVLVLGLGAAQLNRVEQAVDVMNRVGAGRLVGLSGALLVVASFGVDIGLLWPPIGIASTAGLVAYFVVAAGFHVKIHDTIGQILNQLVPAALAAVALWLRIATR